MISTKHGVFRFYDASQALLYVSLSDRSLAKEIARLSSTSWMSDADITRTAVTWYSNVDEAAAVRDSALKTEKPRHNKTPDRVRKTVDISGEAQGALRARLDDGAHALGIPVLSGQKYLGELITVAIEDESVHQEVLERLRSKDD